MALIVQKYGGSSVADTAAMKRVAKRIAKARAQGHQLVVVVSAMGDTTDDLLDMAAELTDNSPAREMDILLSAGERISMSLLSMALHSLDVPAMAYTGAQAGIKTDTRYGKAQILNMVPERIARAIKENTVAIVAGFQGVNEKGDVTTLGRGGSDTTAVALAAALKADVCEIYTDVDGMFSADPRVVPAARQVPRLDYEETLELAANGAKILHLRAVEFARRYQVPLHVRSSFSDKMGTWISEKLAPEALAGIVPEAALKEETVEAPIISGIAHDRSQEKLSIVGLPNRPGAAADLFGTIAKSGANIDMIVQNQSMSRKDRSNISVTMPAEDIPAAIKILEAAQASLDFERLEHDPNVGKVSLVGAGMRTNSGISARFFEALSLAGVNIDIISTSEVRISVLINLDHLDAAVKAVHTAFNLDATETEAVVYGGTGR